MTATQTAVVYLGELAKLAVEYLNSQWPGSPRIVAAGEGRWLVTPVASRWDSGMGRRDPWTRSDLGVIDSAIHEAGSVEALETWIAQRRAGLLT